MRKNMKKLPLPAVRKKTNFREGVDKKRTRTKKETRSMREKATVMQRARETDRRGGDLREGTLVQKSRARPLRVEKKHGFRAKGGAGKGRVFAA